MALVHRVVVAVLRRLRPTVPTLDTRLHEDASGGRTQRVRELVRLVLPGETPRLRVLTADGPPPALEAFAHPLAMVPSGARLRAWPKLEETERRLVVALWGMWRTDPETGRHQVLAEDLISAFFHSFEATVQVLKDEIEGAHGKGSFETFLASHPNNSLRLRAVRTIRLLAVHVKHVVVPSGVSVSAVRGHGGTVTHDWWMPRISAECLASLGRPKLGPGELDAWETLRRRWPAGHLMQEALKDLRQVVFDAEEKWGRA